MSAGTYRALLIGNSTFPDDPHNLFELKGPINDLPLVRDALTHPAAGMFEPANVRLLPDRTKREITTAVEEFFAGATRDDTMFLYYSGHGMVTQFDSLFLCARDTRTSHLVSTGISDVEIDAMMTASSSARFVIVLDCCHSGAFKSAGLPAKLKGKGRFLLTSSRQGELSRDAELRHEPSAFTRHLAEALRGGADSDNDGFVSVNDVYMQILEPLQRETNQVPQRHFDRGAVGDIALARAVAATAAATSTAVSAGRPILAVSPPTIELRDIGIDEELPPEIVDVYNEGDGELTWTARSTVDWIALRPCDGYVELQLRPPRHGVNRGSVHIRARSGGSQTVRVLVEVRQLEARPTLEVSPGELDFGTLTVGATAAPQTLLIKETRLDNPPADVSASARWIELEQTGDVVTVTVDTARAGERSGHVLIRGAGGDRIVPVRAIVEQGPVLDVQPTTIDFGRVKQGRPADATVVVGNSGSGELTWTYGKTGGFFRTRRNRNRLRLELTGNPGKHEGSVWIRSNGGEATVAVRAVVAAKPKPRPKPKQASAPKVDPGSAKATSPAADDTERAGTLYDGRYRIVRKLGAGGMANVYLAEDQELGRRVAIKIFDHRRAGDDQFIERFRREAKNAAGLSHPNIVSIYDRGEAEGTCFIAMEYVDGRSLKELILSRGPAPPRFAIEYARQILAALRLAHSHGVVHRDIKPQNIMVDSEGRLKVTDFGIARAEDAEESIIVTVQYLSPEQVRGAPVDQTSDLYSLGIVLYELLTGTVPFTGTNPVEVAMKHVSTAPVPPSEKRSEIPRELDLVVLRALAKSPSDRYANAGDMDSALAKVAGKL